MPRSPLFKRGCQTATNPTYKRVIVATNTELFQLLRIVTVEQGSAGSLEPLIVASMDDALRLLSVADPFFELIENLRGSL
jgi:hypothetical protein